MSCRKKLKLEDAFLEKKDKLAEQAFDFHPKPSAPFYFNHDEEYSAFVQYMKKSVATLIENNQEMLAQEGNLNVGEVTALGVETAHSCNLAKPTPSKPASQKDKKIKGAQQFGRDQETKTPKTRLKLKRDQQANSPVSGIRRVTPKTCTIAKIAPFNAAHKNTAGEDFQDSTRELEMDDANATQEATTNQQPCSPDGPDKCLVQPLKTIALIPISPSFFNRDQDFLNVLGPLIKPREGCSAENPGQGARIGESSDSEEGSLSIHRLPVITLSPRTPSLFNPNETFLDYFEQEAEANGNSNDTERQQSGDNRNLTNREEDQIYESQPRNSPNKV